MNMSLQGIGTFLKRFFIILFGGSLGVALIGGGAITLLLGAVKSMGYLPEMTVRIGFWQLAQGWIFPVACLLGALLIVSGLASLYKAFAQI